MDKARGGRVVTSIVNRATPAQARLYRIVDGACRDAVAKHPTWDFDRRLANSIAKRAAGTLSGQWPGVLALARSAPDSGGGAPCNPPHGGGGGVVANPRREGIATNAAQERDACDRVPLNRLHRRIGILAAAARRAGLAEREAALIEVLRLIAGENP